MSDAQTFALQMSTAGAILTAFGWWMIERLSSLTPKRVPVRVERRHTQR